MINRFRLQEFKGHRDTNLALARFAMLVGDNGSGKTSVLEALRLQRTVITVNSSSPNAFVTEDFLRRGATEITSLTSEGMSADTPFSLRLAFTDRGEERKVEISGEVARSPFRFEGHFSKYSTSYNYSSHSIASVVGDIRLYRFLPEQIAASSYSDQPGAPVAEDGAQTAVALAALKLADDEAFDRVENAMRRLIPTVERVRIKPAKVRHPAHPSEVVGSKLYFDFRGARDVPAHHASYGTLIVLALLTVLHGPNRPNLILLDDFDHALHPRAQMEVVRMLKELLEFDEYKETQIIATTHSPYVLDELAPENVIAFALREDGTVAAKSLAEHPDAPKVNGSLKSGELWSLDAERDWVL